MPFNGLPKSSIYTNFISYSPNITLDNKYIIYDRMRKLRPRPINEVRVRRENYRFEYTINYTKMCNVRYIIDVKMF